MLSGFLDRPPSEGLEGGLQNKYKSKGNQSWQCNNDTVLATCETWTENCYPRHREQRAAQELLRSFPSFHYLWSPATMSLPQMRSLETPPFTQFWKHLNVFFSSNNYRCLPASTTHTVDIFHRKSPCLTTTRKVFLPSLSKHCHYGCGSFPSVPRGNLITPGYD